MSGKFSPHITNAKRVRLGYITAFLLLIFSLGLTNLITKKLVFQTNDVAETNAVINTLEQVLSYVKDAETGMRGYFIMKDSSYLEPYNNSRYKVDSLLTLLRQHTAGNDVKQQQLQLLNHLIDKRYIVIYNALDTFAAHNNETGIFLSQKLKTGKSVMDSLRVQVKAIQDYERTELQHRQQKASHIASSINYINIASLVVSLLLVFYVISTFNRENRASNEANKQADDYRTLLEKRVAELRSANVELVALRNNEKFASTGRIARTIAHEVRNPLTNINLALEQLQEEITQVEGADVLIGMIERNSLRIQQLITDLLRSTKFAELQFSNMAINELINQALDQAQDRLLLNRITVVKNYSNHLSSIYVDAEKLKIGILNIIVNAIEAMQPGEGLLTISTFKQNETCCITIADNGKGMDAETLQKLFEPYFTRKSTGNGLGLTNTQNIILNHKGLVSVESEEDKGTTFTIKLPFPVHAIYC